MVKGGVSEIAVDHRELALGQALLMEAVGTAEPDFLNGLLGRLANAGTGGRVVDEHGLNFMLAVVKGVEPRDQLEAMLAAQMAAVHNATMTFARRLNHVESIPQQDSAVRAFTKLARSFAAQVEALKRYPDRRRAKGHGGARHGERRRTSHRRERDTWGAGARKEMEGILMNREYCFQKAPRCRATSKRTREPCKAPAVRGWTVCRFHGARGGAPKGEENGAYRHGLYTAEAIEERRALRKLLRESRELLAMLPCESES